MRKVIEAPASDLMTLPEVAKALRLQKGAVYGGLRRRLPWINLNSRLRLRRSDLEAFIDSCREQQAA
jgi:hypothetical protein